MARPVNADSEATRQRVLSSALLLFADNGVGGTSIREVAKGAGVSLAMVHHYFGNKDGLYQSCIASMYAELETLVAELEPEFLAEGVPGEAGIAERLDRIVRAGYRFCREHRAALRLLMRTVIDRGELDGEWQREKHIPFLGRAAELLAALLDRPEPQMRLAVQSVNHLVIRYALSSPRELALVAGTHADPDASPEPSASAEAVARVEDHLVATAGRLLGLSV